MKEIKENTYKGTRILLGNEKRNIINNMINVLLNNEFIEISIPIIQMSETFKDKVGKENNNLMYNFTDRGNRNICLAPEYTAVIQKLSKTTFKYEKDVKLFYIQECFRGEKPQRGRYRQFTQLGIEILNPTKDYIEELSTLAFSMINIKDARIDKEVVRGLDYYKNGKGFEISYDGMQLCGGGEYDGGVGFAIGIDRLILEG